jgi:hypothetical protein
LVWHNVEIGHLSHRLRIRVFSGTREDGEEDCIFSLAPDLLGLLPLSLVEIWTAKHVSPKMAILLTTKMFEKCVGVGHIKRDQRGVLPVEGHT